MSNLVYKQLIEHYSKTSKHSNYQILPDRLKKIIGSNEIQTKTRYEKERLDYILEHLPVRNTKVPDIGGNTGYFTFEMLEAGASHAYYYEGNPDHAEFVRQGATLVDYSYLGLEKVIRANYSGQPGVQFRERATRVDHCPQAAPQRPANAGPP
jgi:hypothetical protein